MKPSLLDEDDVDVLHEGLVEATTIGLLIISHVMPMFQVFSFFNFSWHGFIFVN